MRALLPRCLDRPDLHAVYADDWLDTTAVRANFVTSLDGAVAVGATSRGLQTPGDQAVFAVLRDLADVVLVGRSTAELEDYGALRSSARRARIRESLGLAPQLPTAVVSATLDLPLDSPLFDYADGAPRTVVITVAGAGRQAEFAAVADVIVAGTDTLDVAAALGQLRERGFRRILTEGGPRLFGTLLAAGAVDELCLTTVPRLVGSASGRITGGVPLPVPGEAVLRSLLTEDGATFARYRIAGVPAATMSG
jgi:riboflavin biosynthesis pyrimidine reductase